MKQNTTVPAIVFLLIGGFSLLFSLTNLNGFFIIFSVSGSGDVFLRQRLLPSFIFQLLVIFTNLLIFIAGARLATSKSPVGAGPATVGAILRLICISYSLSVVFRSDSLASHYLFIRIVLPVLLSVTCLVMARKVKRSLVP